MVSGWAKETCDCKVFIIYPAANILVPVISSRPPVSKKSPAGVSHQVFFEAFDLNSKR